MEPIHSIHYQLTNELATTIHQRLLRWELRRGWREDVPTFLGAMVFAGLLVELARRGWILGGFAAGLLCLLMLFVLGAVYRRLATSRMAAGMALLALPSTDRQVRIEFNEKHVRIETEYYRGEGAWDELDEMVVFPGFWVLSFANGGRVVVPAELLTPELEAFLNSKAAQVTAPIRQG